jgi:acetyl esterase/lipase
MNLKKCAILAVNALIMSMACFSGYAEDAVMPLWPDKVPGEVSTKEETSATRGGVTRLSEISIPTLTPYILKTDEARPLVVVCPGGGYNILAWDKEGLEIAEWFNTQGLHAAVLKYRVPRNRDGAFQDVQRAIRLVRAHAKDWNVKSDSIGVMGFSAGGHLAASASMFSSKQSYDPIDDADQLSARPDFTMLIYPAYLGTDENELVAGLSIPADHPPCFVMQTKDDRYAVSAIAYSKALEQAGISHETQLFESGGHGYGMRKRGKPVDAWPDTLKAWLVSQKLATEQTPTP